MSRPSTSARRRASPSRWPATVRLCSSCTASAATAATGRRTPDNVRKLLGSRAKAGAFEALWESVLATRDESYRKTLEASVAQDRGAPLENIRVPTLVVAGDEDTVYPPDLARDVARRIPGAELVMIKGAGHLVNLERPGRFNEVLMDFIERQERKS